MTGEIRCGLERRLHNLQVAIAFLGRRQLGEWRRARFAYIYACPWLPRSPGEFSQHINCSQTFLNGWVQRVLGQGRELWRGAEPWLAA
jgi:hypothetical protein